MSNLCKITGLGDRRFIEGKINVSSSKNGIIPSMAATLMFESKVFLKNFPNINDTNSLLRALTFLGSKVEKKGSVVEITNDNITSTDLPREEVKKTRGVIALTGPLLARFGGFSITKVGGCSIGERPIDFYLEFYRALGAEIKEDGEKIICTAKELTGVDFTFKRKSVVATYVCAMTASLSKGRTILRNCALEPEVTGVLNFLKENGVSIEGIGTDTLTIDGSDGKLLKAKTEFVNGPDRIETCGLVLLGVLAAKDLTISNCNTDEIKSLLDVLNSIQFKGITVEKNSINIKPPEGFSLSKCKPFKLETEEYPGFPTDVQTQMLVLATKLNGTSHMKENIFEWRIRKQVEEIKKFGGIVNIKSDSEVELTGPVKLTGTEVDALDIRAGFAFIILSVIAEGVTKINNVSLIERGYENIWERLGSIGLIVK